MLAGRVPVQLSPQQSLLVFVVAGVAGLGLVAGVLLETLVGGGIAALLRAVGVRAPAKSRARTAIDELEARVRGSHGDGRPPQAPV